MGIWGIDERMDVFDISDDRVRRNAKSVTAVCMKIDLLDTGDGYQELRVRNYGETYTLCASERFYDQPVAYCLMSSGVLVAPDVVATTAHLAGETNVRSLRFLFGYVMSDPISPFTRFPNENVYRGVEIVHREYDVDGLDASGSDWALVRLDRKVEGQEIAALSRRNVFYDQPLYALGHPCGLPLKYAPGGLVEDIRTAYFMAQMDLYSGNSGSPVFCAKTHEMVGMVSRTDVRDFRWFKDGCVSVVYPNKKIKSSGALCIKVSEFNKYIVSINDKVDVDGVKIQPPEVSTPSQEENFLQELRSEIEKNLSNPDFNIDLLCKKLYIGRSTLFKKIKAKTGETPNQYIQSYRLDRAAQLFKENFGNVTEVTEAVGFPDQFYFSKCFKKKFGQPPKVYQLSHLKNVSSKDRDEKTDSSEVVDTGSYIKINIEFTLEELDRELVYRLPLPKLEKLFKSKVGTPQRDEIFEQVTKLYDTTTVLNEALKHHTNQELIQKILMMKKKKKSDTFR